MPAKSEEDEPRVNGSQDLRTNITLETLHQYDTQCFHADPGLQKMCVYRSAVNLTKLPVADRV